MGRRCFCERQKSSCGSNAHEIKEDSVIYILFKCGKTSDESSNFKVLRLTFAEPFVDAIEKLLSI